MAQLDEKTVSRSNSSIERGIPVYGSKEAYLDTTLVDPSHDTLHRALKARQISMIAVRFFSLETMILELI